MVVPGQRVLIARMVRAQISAPPSLSSSRLTEVRTQCWSFMSSTARAARSGSSQSSSVGRPVSTAQKPQERVQILPRSMRVAVPAPQHSPILGQWALSQTVWRRFSSMTLRTKR